MRPQTNLPQAPTAQAGPRPATAAPRAGTGAEATLD